MKLRNTRRDHTESEDLLILNYQETSQADYSGSPPPYGIIPLDYVDNRKEAAELEKRNREWLERHREHHRELKRKRDAHIERIKRHGLVNSWETSPAPGPAPMAANPSNDPTRRTPSLQKTYENLNSISGVANPESIPYRTRRIRLNAGLRKFPLLALSSSKKWRVARRYTKTIPPVQETSGQLISRPVTNPALHPHQQAKLADSPFHDSGKKVLYKV